MAAAVAGTAAVWLVAHAGFSVDVQAESGGTVQTVGLPAVVVATLVAGLAAWGLLAVLERRAAKPARLFVIIALVALVLSMGGPLGGRTGAAKAVLVSLHLMAALILVPGLARTAVPRIRPSAAG